MKKLVQLARVGLKSLAANKLRSALTMLGVVIGVAAVIVMVSIGQGAKENVAKNIQGLGTNLLVVRPGFDRKGPVTMNNVQTLNYEDAKALTEIPDVAFVAPEVGQGTQVKFLGKNTNTTVLGTTEAYATVNNYQLQSGRLLDAEDLRAHRKVAVIGATPAKDLFGEVAPVGQTIKVRGTNFDVVGVLEAKGQSGFRDPDDQILIPLTTAQSQLFGLTHVRAISVQVASEQAMDRVQADIEDVLRTRHRIEEQNPSDFNIRNQKEILATMTEVSDTFTTLLAAIAAVSMLVGGIGIMNIMLVSVTERTREIGVRKALGARQRDVLWQFLVEAMTLTGAGGVIGVVVGLGVGKLIDIVTPLSFAVPLWGILLAFGSSTAIGLFFGLYPAVKAARLDPVDSLRYE